MEFPFWKSTHLKVSGVPKEDFKYGVTPSCEALPVKVASTLNFFDFPASIS